MDFKLDDDLDLAVEDGEFVLQQNDETTLIAAFFTDGRIAGKRGYWLDILASDMWQFDQARVKGDVAVGLNEEAQEISRDLINDGIFERIETNAYIKSGEIVLEVSAFNLNEEMPVVNRRFVI